MRLERPIPRIKIQSTEPSAPATNDAWIDTGSTISSTSEGARVYKSASTQSIANATHVAVTFDAESYDDNGYHSTASNTSRLTIPATDRYRIWGQAEYAAATTVWSDTNRYYVFASIWLNGTGTGSRLGMATGPIMNLDTVTAMRVQVDTGVVELTAGDYVELGAIQSQGAARNVATGAGSTWLCIERVA